MFYIIRAISEIRDLKIFVKQEQEQEVFYGSRIMLISRMGLKWGLGRIRGKGEVMAEIIYKDESYALIGACMEVYNEKGFGFHEAVYQECLELELGLQSIPFDAQKELTLEYKGHRLEHTYVPDLLCYGKIVVELKAVSALSDEHRGQVLNYLRATGMKLGILVNFGNSKKLEWERIVLT